MFTDGTGDAGPADPLPPVRDCAGASPGEMLLARLGGAGEAAPSG